MWIVYLVQLKNFKARKKIQNIKNTLLIQNLKIFQTKMIKKDTINDNELVCLF